MPKYYYTYEKSFIVESEVEIPADFVAKGNKAIRNFIRETVYHEDFDPNDSSEHEEVRFQEAQDGR